MGILSRFSQHSADKAEHQKLIDEFHAHHDHLDHLAKQLHQAGYHINVDYDSPHVVRHDRKTGVHFWNVGLKAKKKIQISRKIPQRPFDKG